METMNESILVCVYYGPNGERLIKRGCKIARMLNCPLYILTVDSKPLDDLDAEKTNYIARWKELAEQHNAQSFIIRDNEKRPISKVVAEVAREKSITQIILGQTAQSRWEQIAKGSIINSLLREIPFVDLHIISVSRFLKILKVILKKEFVPILLRKKIIIALSLIIQNLLSLKEFSLKNMGQTLTTEFSNS
jgi:K+-sensing histidine kinase KdpD